MLSVRQHPRSKRIQPDFPTTKLQLGANVFISPVTNYRSPKRAPPDHSGRHLMRSLFKRRTGSHIALAIALVTGTAVGVPGFAAE